MKLFSFSKTNVKEIDQKPFKLEKDIQGIIENNIGTFFNLLFIQLTWCNEYGCKG